MKKIFTNDKISQLFNIINSAKRIAIISHTNPDGDAIGSSLALYRALLKIENNTQKDIRIIVPNSMPDYLEFLDTQKAVTTFAYNEKECGAFLAASDLIFVVDFNNTTRLEKMSEALERNICATRVLVDHHIDPPKFDLEFHSTQSSSAGFLAYLLIKELGITIDTTIATPLYTAMMTDTGGFMFGNLNTELYTAVSELAATGIDIASINREVFNNQTLNKVKLTGYLLSDKLTVNLPKKSAYITLSLEEKDKFEYKIGDTEGVVNIPLTVQGVVFSALLIENKDHIKLSLRSIGELDVNIICNEHFNGGGHKNAAGGKFYGTMTECENAIKSIIDRF